jgi:hypothetical protein
MLKSGDVVRIINEQSKPEINGVVGYIERFDKITKRYIIQIRTNGSITRVNLKQDNIELVNDFKESAIFDVSWASGEEEA